MNEKTERNPKGSGRPKGEPTQTKTIRVKVSTLKKLNNIGFKWNRDINKFLDNKAAQIK